MRKSFALREGTLTISSSSRSAAGRHRSECRVRPTAFSPGRLDFNCTGNGIYFGEMTGRYDGERLIMVPVWKRRNAPPSDWPEFLWRRVDSSRLEIVSDPEPGLSIWKPMRSSTFGHIVLARTAEPE